MRKNLPVVFALLALAVVPAVRGAADLYIQWLWFLEVGYKEVFLTVFLTGVELGVAVGGALLVLLLVNMFIAYRATKYTVLVESVRVLEIPGREVMESQVRLVLLGASLFLSVVMGIEASNRWEIFLQYANASPFGLKDPLFGLDVSHYVFKLPVYLYALQAATAGLVLSLALTIAVYLYKKGIGLSPRGLHFHKPVLVHVSILAGLFFLVRACGYVLARYQLLSTTRSIIQGAGYTDVHVRLPFLTVLAGVAAAAALICFVNVVLRRWTPLLFAVAALALTSVAGAGLPMLFQQLRVAPNEIAMESPFIKRQIEFTRIGWGLNEVTEKELSLRTEVTALDIASNPLTIRNIRLWDQRPLLETYRQLQEIRTYYYFGDVDIDRYYVNGKYTQVTLSPRELAYDKLPAKIWINEHLTYTHGHGLCMSPVSTFTPEGLPNFMLKDIPPVSTIDMKIDQPEIYFGEYPNDYVFVRTKAKEFDYPVGRDNKYTTYAGSAGIPVSSPLRRLALAIRFGSLSILLNSDIKPDSRVLVNRRIVQRAMSAMQMLTYDPDPYMVIDNGRLLWVLDGYTMTRNFPYSHPSGAASFTFNYIRNPVKTVIDAYNGTIKMYVIDPTDPIIATYSRIFPGVFKPIEEMPASLRAHMRYPQWLFRAQAEIYSTYQMSDPQVFYNKEDMWSVPREVFYSEKQEVEPYYTIMKLPDESREEFILMLPFTPSRRDNLSAWMCARNDGGNYGRLLVYKFPKDKLFYGPLQIEGRIDQDPEISRQFSLWGQKGSEIIRGNLLVIPLGDTLLYVEPIYLQAENGKIPELKRVVVAAGNRVVMEETLEIALQKLVVEGAVTVTDDGGGKKPIKSTGDLPADARKRIEDAAAALDAAKKSLEDGDWSAFGDAMQKMEKLLKP